MNGLIGYYVHHHGRGHLHRAAAIARAARSPVVGFSSLPAPASWPGRWIRLPDDADGVHQGSADRGRADQSGADRGRADVSRADRSRADRGRADVSRADQSRADRGRADRGQSRADHSRADVTAGGTLHWAPRHHPGLAERAGLISAELATGRIRLLVADVSVEVALLARLHGVPVVVMAQPGDRTDPAHRLAYDLAERLIAPWPPRSSPGWPQAWQDKTVHVGAVSRFDGRPRSGGLAARRVLALWGSGGLDVDAAQLQAAAAATPEWSWQVAGPPGPAGQGPPNLRWRGWVDDIWPELGDADVVVTHAGQNALAEVAAARRAAVVIPQRRPHDEQAATARALDRSRTAVVVAAWPQPAAWAALLARSTALGGDRWSSWSTGTGAAQAAAVLDDLVDAG